MLASVASVSTMVRLKEGIVLLCPEIASRGNSESFGMDHILQQLLQIPFWQSRDVLSG